MLALPRSLAGTLRQFLAGLVRHRHLTWEMTRREIKDRYAGQVLGFFWAIGHPLILLGIYVFVFTQVFKIKMNPPTANALDYSVYILSGLIPWLAFAEVLNKSSSLLTANAGLVKQTVFPIQVLPIKGVLAALLTQLIGTAFLLAYVLVTFGSVPWTFCLLPVLWSAQFLAMVGLSYLLATVGAYFRDLKDMVQVFCVLNIYLMPIFYLPDWIPGGLKFLVYLNPFSYVGWCYQDACFYGAIEHPLAWVLFLSGSGLICLVGFKMFEKFKLSFASVL